MFSPRSPPPHPRLELGGLPVSDSRGRRGGSRVRRLGTAGRDAAGHSLPHRDIMKPPEATCGALAARFLHRRPENAPVAQVLRPTAFRRPDGSVSPPGPCGPSMFYSLASYIFHGLSFPGGFREMHSMSLSAAWPSFRLDMAASTQIRTVCPVRQNLIVSVFHF